MLRKLTHVQPLHPDPSPTRGEKETEAQRPVKGFTRKEHLISSGGKAGLKQKNRCDGMRGLCLVKTFAVHRLTAHEQAALHDETGLTGAAANSGHTRALGG